MYVLAMTGYGDLVHASHVLYCTAGDRVDTPLHIVAISHLQGGTDAPLWYISCPQGGAAWRGAPAE